MELGAGNQSKLSQDLHLTLPQGPSLQLVWPPELNTSAGQCPVPPLKGWIYHPGGSYMEFLNIT